MAALPPRRHSYTTRCLNKVSENYSATFRLIKKRKKVESCLLTLEKQIHTGGILEVYKMIHGFLDID